MPSSLLRYRLAKEFGWTLQQINQTPWHELNEILVAMDVEARAANRRQQTQHRKRR
jgi:hypothetical protein